jgi:three-Cys-motif partner protein
LQVAWDTLVAISSTKALDVWILFPTGIGLNRLLTKDGNIPSEWQDVLDRFLGTVKWRDAFYKIEEVTDLFRAVDYRRVKDADAKKFETFLLDRLRSIFPVVMDSGVPLTNSKGQIMYLLLFASANPSPKVKSLALKLAEWAARV